MASGYATVKEVVSGDTLVLVGQPNNGPPPEIRLSLASLVAPRLGAPKSGSEATKDEPFAWQSREFLRKLCIGQYVAFKVEFAAPAINRQYGQVRLSTGTKENLCIVVAREGWAKVKRDAPAGEQSADYEEMLRVNATAEEKGLGVFNSDPDAIKRSIRNVQYELKNPAELLQRMKGVSQNAVIEYVRDGGSFKVYLTEEDAVVNFNLAGVQCPRVNAGDATNGPEPFAREAKYFTEIRLLHRDVGVIINGMDDRSNTFYGSILHPAGDISTELVKNGLAKAVDWSMQFTSLQLAGSIRGAARDAKQNRVRIWQSYEAPKITGDKSFEGVVSEIVSGDTLMIRVGTQQQLTGKLWECQERRVSLSSIRAPRIGSRVRGQPDEPYAAEAREVLRKNALGKRCLVTIDYERAAPPGAVGLAAKPRAFGTVLLLKKKQKNVAELVLEEGLAEIIRHRPDDERSPHYDELQVVQESAKEAQKGMHSANPITSVPESRFLDMTSNAAKARTLIGTLQEPKFGSQRAGVHKAIVEYVVNGSRMRIFLPEENVLLNFALGGIQTPQTARTASKGRAATEEEPFAVESTLYTRFLVLQRQVEVEIESADKGGTAIGQMTFKNGQDSINLAVQILEVGLGRTNERSVRYARNADSLLRAEKQAKDQRLNIWKDYVEPSAEDLEKLSLGASGNGVIESVPVCVSEIVDGSTFYLQKLSEKSKLDSIETTLAALGPAVPGADNTGIMEPKKNMNCLAIFDDGTGPKWFRAKILTAHIKGSPGVSHIRYIDYGNEEKVEADRLRIAPDSLFVAPPCAEPAQLAFVKIPAVDREFGREAAIALSDMVFGKEVSALVHSKGADKLSVSLVLPGKAEEDSKEPENVAEILLNEGLGYVDEFQTRYVKTEQEKLLVAKLTAAQNQAHKSHINLWQYGDPRDDDN